MSQEKPQSKSENYGLYEGWELIAEIPPLPLVIPGDLIEDAFGDFSND